MQKVLTIRNGPQMTINAETAQLGKFRSKYNYLRTYHTYLYGRRDWATPGRGTRRIQVQSEWLVPT